MDTFPLGGISKSLLALLHQLDGKYDIDMLLMRQTGLFIPLIPNSVHLVPEPIESTFRNPNPRYILSALKSLPLGRFISWLNLSARCSVARIIGGLHRQINVLDAWLGRHTRAIGKHYDAAIAYQGGRCIYYLIENVDADVKIGYVHNDYTQSEVDFMMKPTDRRYFPQLDDIVTISPKCAASLANEFPQLKNKIKVIENICSPSMIRSLASKNVEFDENYNGSRLITMCRIDIHQKGLDFAVEVCRILKANGLDFKWYILGDGDERPVLERMIKENQVQDCLILAGAKFNPYAFIRQADIYVQPSRYEGKSVALDEVKALAKPTVVTNFSTVNDQFENERTAIVCDMTPQSIADAIMRLINEPELCEKLSANLAAEKVGNEEQAQVFESLLEKGK